MIERLALILWMVLGMSLDGSPSCTIAVLFAAATITTAFVIRKESKYV